MFDIMIFTIFRQRLHKQRPQDRPSRPQERPRRAYIFRFPTRDPRGVQGASGLTGERVGDFTAAGAPREKNEKLCFATFIFIVFCGFPCFFLCFYVFFLACFVIFTFFVVFPSFF